VMYATISSVRFYSHLFCREFMFYLRILVSIMVSIADDVCVV
jgi:hypothetical protein